MFLTNREIKILFHIPKLHEKFKKKYFYSEVDILFYPFKTNKQKKQMLWKLNGH